MALPVLMNAVKSSNVQSIGYDRENRELHVIFGKPSGKPSRLYRYQDVTLEEYEAVMASDSKGSAINSSIKPNHECI